MKRTLFGIFVGLVVLGTITQFFCIYNCQQERIQENIATFNPLSACPYCQS